MRKRIKFWWVRLWYGHAATKFNMPFHTDKKVGDIVVTGERDLEYIGKGKYLLISKQESMKLPRGVRIDNWLKSSGRAQNQFVVRDGKVLATRVNKPK